MKFRQFCEHHQCTPGEADALRAFLIAWHTARLIARLA